MPNSKIDRFYKRLGLPNHPTLVTSVSRGAPITFARIRLDCAGRTFDGILADDAYTFHVNFLKQMPFSAAFTKKRAPGRHLLREGDSAMVDRREPVAAATMYSSSSGGRRGRRTRPSASSRVADQLVSLLLASPACPTVPNCRRSWGFRNVSVAFRGSAEAISRRRGSL